MDNQLFPSDDSSEVSDSELEDVFYTGPERPAPEENSTAVLPLPHYRIAHPPFWQADTEDLTGIIKPKYKPEYKRIIGAMFFKPRSIRDLEGFEATRLTLKAPDEIDEIKDGWFELALSDLSDDVRHCARSCFDTVRDYPPSYELCPWRDGIPRQFIDYASLVARGDPLRGGWDGLLRQHLPRVSLCTGILSKILERNVFDKHLFGASESQEKLLTDLDVQLIAAEGYQRTSQRADIVRSLLPDPNQLPPLFWGDVDRIALQITQLLIPLVNLNGRVYKNENWDSTQKMYQDLHSIVAKAGFITNMMRRSATIFRIEFPAPGDTSTRDQEQVATRIYSYSKMASDAKRKVRLTGTETDTDPPPLEYQARVQIVLWPSIKRFRPIGLRGAGASRGATRGESISRLTKAHCAYYSGSMAESIHSAELMPLQAHIASAKWEDRRVRRRALARRARAAGRKALRFGRRAALPIVVLLVFLALLAAFLNGCLPSDIRIPDRLRDVEWPRIPKWRELFPWEGLVAAVKAQKGPKTRTTEPMSVTTEIRPARVTTSWRYKGGWVDGAL